MSTTGPTAPGSVVSENNGGDVAWSDTSNAIASDDVFAAASPVPDGLITEDLRATNFNFGIASDATITGVQVKIRAGSALELLNEDGVFLRVNGEAINFADNHSTSFLLPADPAIITYGDENDLWGYDLTPAKVNHANFGVMFSFRNNSGVEDGNVYVDYITVEVFYTGGDGRITKQSRSLRRAVADPHPDILEW